LQYICRLGVMPVEPYEMTQDDLDRQIKNAQKGRGGGAARLVGEYGPRLYGYFFRVCGSAGDAEDLVQDVFVRVLKNIKGYRHEDKFEHWLFRIAANLARDRARKLARRGTVISLETDEQVPDKQSEPYQRMIDDEQRDKLQQALKQLPQLDREMIMLRHYSQMSFKEIAKQFNVPLGTALAKVHRGLKQLKQKLSENETQTKTNR
jgi:RNA polymerase sigma-70 factor (ECF subfamily)